VRNAFRFSVVSAALALTLAFGITVALLWVEVLWGAARTPKNTTVRHATTGNTEPIRLGNLVFPVIALSPFEQSH
jgi:hypothetical protein